MRLSITTIVAALSLSFAATSADAQSRVRAGGLACNVSPTVGLIINRTISLQPPSLQGQVGVNLALGVAA